MMIMMQQDPIMRSPSEHSASERVSKTSERISTFDDKERICEVLTQGSVEVLGSLRDILGDLVKPHTNKADFAEVTPETSLMVIEGGSESVYAVWKPCIGESKEMLDRMGITEMYPREAISFRVSEHFGFGLVPPTVTRVIGVEGVYGSLQQFMDLGDWGTNSQMERLQESGRSPSRMPGEPEQLEQEWDDYFDEITRSLRYKVLALFDFLTLNFDRHGENILYRRQIENQQPEVVAIDNGCSFSPLGYLSYPSTGPSEFLNRPTQRTAGMADLPLEVIDRLLVGRSKKEELNIYMAPHLTNEEIARFWSRVDHVIANKKVCSKDVLSPSEQIRLIGGAIR
jgi:hypothetical protein